VRVRLLNMMREAAARVEHGRTSTRRVPVLGRRPAGTPMRAPGRRREAAARFLFAFPAAPW
ncbi:MAG: hypothetical protein ACUVYA_21070, partial [Planctomycetota bacterium]